MKDSFKGVCKRGPWDGQWYAYHAKRMPVAIYDFGSVQHYAYEFFDGVWFWDGPRVKDRKHHVG